MTNTAIRTHSKEASGLHLHTSNMIETQKRGEIPSATSGLEFEEGTLLLSASSVYSVMEEIGEGLFGKVVRCTNEASRDSVAIKVFKKHQENYVKSELSILEAITVLDPDQANLVRFHESFIDMGHQNMAFELLDVDLRKLIQLHDYHPLLPCDIRIVGKQLLEGVNALKGLGILHGNIKPENILLVNANQRPLRIKLGDFELATRVSDVFAGMVVQPIGYRAPEVCLGLPFNEAIDMWGVGCVLAYLYLGGNLFPVKCRYQMMKSIVTLLGQPQDHLLSKGGYSWRYFTQEADQSSTWRLMTPEEYSLANTTPAKQQRPRLELPGGLDDLVEIYPFLDQAEMEERLTMVNLLKGLLHMDGEQRRTPREALDHPFFQMSDRDEDPHLSGPLDEMAPVETDTSSTQSPQDSDSTVEFMEQDPDCEPLVDKMSVAPLEEPAAPSTSSIEDPQDSDTFAEFMEKEPVKSVAPLEEPAAKSSSSLEDLQDSDSGVLEPSESLVSVPEINDNVCDAEDSSESAEEFEEEEKYLPGPTSSKGRFKQLRKRIGRIFRRIQKTFCSCFRPEIDD